MAECFERLQEEATIDNYLAGTTRSPKKAAPQAKLAGKPASR